jgi:hypothetical protein
VVWPWQAAVIRVREEWEAKEREKEAIMVMAIAENQGQRDSNRRLSSLDLGGSLDLRDVPDEPLFPPLRSGDGAADVSLQDPWNPY